MLENYLKMTLAVMKRRKFYTFISLFGISFTLMVLIVLASFYDHLFGSNYPEFHRDRTLYVHMVQQKNSEKGWSSAGPMSFSYGRKYIKTMKTPEKVSLSTQPNTLNTYIAGKKLKLFVKYTDAEFWQLTDFEFLEGKPYTQQDIDNNKFGIVINDGTRDNCFGKGAAAVGKPLEIDNVTYQVVGVVRGCPITRITVSSDVYLPYNTSKSDLNDPGLMGSYLACIQLQRPEDVPTAQTEYREIVSKVPLPDKSEYDQFISSADTQLGMLTRNIVGSIEDDGKTRFFTILFAFALLFMLLPALNLVNVNISRIMERASEIGIRKAFGASKKTLVLQFLVENILLTVIGGLLALLFSALVIVMINRSGWIEYADLRINWMVALVAFVVSLVFGLMSGVYPAWKMSKMQVADALKGTD